MYVLFVMNNFITNELVTTFSDLMSDKHEWLPVDIGDNLSNVSMLLCCRYTDSLTHKRHEVRLVAQLCVKPGAYKVSDAHISETDDNDGQIDAKFSNSELEWSTKERGSTSLSALLIRVD